MSVSSTISSGTGNKSAMEEAAQSPTSVVGTSLAARNANTSTSSNDPTDDGHCDEEDLRSPTCVTMVCSSSSATLLPTAAATVTKPAVSKVNVMPKPFFVMDWLEEVNPRDLELARQMLNTPTKNGKLQQRSMSTPVLSSTPPSSSSATSNPQLSQSQTRSSINLPTLNHQEDDSVCRQLYPDSAPTSPDLNGSEDNNTTSMSRATSSTSISTAVSSPEAAETTPKQKTNKHAAKMSPFKKRSIAIGNGWNAKGLNKAKKGSWESALMCWENALEIRTQVLGETHPDVANTCNNIGIALGKLGRFDAAIEVLERALELRAKHYGTREHVEVAATLHNIGNVLHAAQDCAGAIQCFWDAKLLQEQLLGPDHVQVARACVAIANVYYEAQQYEDAREAYFDALQVFGRAGLSEKHPEILAIQQDLQDIESICFRQQQQEQQHHPIVAAHYHNHQQMMFHHHYHHHESHNHMSYFAASPQEGM